MLAGFGAVIAEMIDVVKAYLVLAIGIRDLCGDSLLDLGLEVNAVLVLDLKEPAHMVDTRDLFLTTFETVVHAELLQ